MIFPLRSAGMSRRTGSVTWQGYVAGNSSRLRCQSFGLGPRGRPECSRFPPCLPASKSNDACRVRRARRFRRSIMIGMVLAIDLFVKPTREKSRPRGNRISNPSIQSLREPRARSERDRTQESQPRSRRPDLDPFHPKPLRSAQSRARAESESNPRTQLRERAARAAALEEGLGAKPPRASDARNRTRGAYAASFSARNRRSHGTVSFIMSTSGASSAPSAKTYDSVLA